MANKTMNLLPVLLQQEHPTHQQKIRLYLSKYIAIYSNKVIIKFEIQAAKYLQIQVTSKTQSTARNVYFTIPPMVCKGCRGC
jgi:hypothetical protein